MHFSAFKLPSCRARVIRLVACAILPACLPQVNAGGHALPGIRTHAVRTASLSRPMSPPYLLVCLPPPLRFAEPVEIVPPPVVIGPPHPSGIIEEIAALNHEAALSAPPAAASPAPPAVAGPETAPGQEPPATQATPPAPGVSILPDETPRQIRSEDVLPYFQFPARVPSEGPALPRSSATYQQQ